MTDSEKYPIRTRVMIWLVLAFASWGVVLALGYGIAAAVQ